MLHSWYSKSDVFSHVPPPPREEKASSKLHPIKEAWLLQNNAESSRSWKFATEAPLPPPSGGEGAASVPGSKHTMEVQEMISSEHLHLLKRRFERGGKMGPGRMTLKEFAAFFQDHFTDQYMWRQELETFFMKLDVDSDGVIDWDEFCTYTQTELYGQDEAAVHQTETNFVLPAITVSAPSNDHINQISHLRDGTVVTCSSDGVVCMWSADLVPKRKKKPELGPTGKPQWATDIAIAHQHSKIIIATGDNCIQFFELSNFEPYCQLAYLENLALKLDFWCDPKDVNNCVLCYADEKAYLNILLLPNILEDFKVWKKGAKKNNIPTCPLSLVIPLNGPSPTGLLYYRWKVHNSWISKLQYYGAVNAVFSSSPDPDASLVIGSPKGSTQVEASLADICFPTDAASSLLTPRSSSSAAMSRPGTSLSSSFVLRKQLSSTPSADSSVVLQVARPPSSLPRSAQFARPNSSFPSRQRTAADQRVFKIPKGVHAFDFSVEYNVVVTGGLDQVVRVWNPYMTSKPVCQMFGHTSPILSVYIAEAEEKIYTIAFDNCVKLWNLREYQCLTTVISGVHKVTGNVDVAVYNPVLKSVVMGGDHLHILRQRTRISVSELVHTHDSPVVSVKYSSCFKQVITVCEGSVMKVWSLSDGKRRTETTSLHGDSPVTSLVLDTSGRRAFTASQNGEIKVWNHNNGQCLRTLKRDNEEEVCDLCVVTMGMQGCSYLVAVGWDRQLNVFQDLRDSSLQQVNYALQQWSKTSRGLHKEDILSVAYGPPSFLATSSFDGQVIVWSFISGAVFCHIQTPPIKSSSIASEGDQSVSKVLFLHQRMRHRTGASLVAGSYSGHVYFWDFYHPQHPHGQFNAMAGQPISTMAVNRENSLLFVADNLGYVSVFDIDDYCTKGHSSTPPTGVNKWRAHVKKISCLEYVEDDSLLISSSHDGCVRLWNTNGQFVGTFGQPEPWKLSHPSTYQHPKLPNETIFDTQGLPSIKTSTAGDGKERTRSESMAFGASTDTHAGRVSAGKEDDQGEEEEEEEEEGKEENKGHLSVSVPRDERKVGKRLRHVRTRENPLERGGYAAHYHSLKFYNINDSPPSPIPIWDDNED